MIKTRKLTDHEMALKIEAEDLNVREWDSKNWKRCTENWRMYWGIDNDKGFGQWPAEVAAQMIQQGRHVATYNLCRPTVDNIVGGLCMAPFSFDYSPVNSEVNSLSYIAKEIMYQEQELMDWRSEEESLYIGGCAYQGVWEMYLSTEYARRGTGEKNIGFRTMLPGAVRFDPNWKEARSKKCRKAWRDVWLSAKEILEIYGTDKEKWGSVVRAVAFKAGGREELEKLAEMQEVLGDEYGYNSGIIPYGDNDDIWGSKYKVTMYYRMEKVGKNIEYVRLPDGSRKIIPATIEYPDEKLSWLQENVPNWSNEMLELVFSDTEYEDIQFMSAICPGLQHGLLLCNGPTEIQCGRLQFFPWSAYRANGEFGGVIDSIKDMQYSVNYLESMLTYKLQIEGGGGAQFAEEGAFAPGEYQRWIKERNNPQAVFKLKKGTLLRYPNGPTRPVVTSPYPAEAMDRLTHIIETMWGKISKVSPATRGETESASESGYLFNLKKLQSAQELYTIHESLRNFWNEVGEAYLYQAINTHGNGIERTFYNPKTKSTTTINKRELYVDVDGSIVEAIIDNFEELKEIRHKVMVTESSDSPTRRLEVMQTSDTLLQKTDPNTNPITRQLLFSKLALSTDTFSDEEKIEFEAASKKELSAAEAQVEAQKAESYQRIAAASGVGVQEPGAGAGQMQQQTANVHPVTGASPDQMGLNVGTVTQPELAAA